MGRRVAALADGQIVAVKGLGGFHLACDATDDAAVAQLRERKGRIDKPFAVMAADLETVAQIAQLDDAEPASADQPPSVPSSSCANGPTAPSPISSRPATAPSA